jgi:hypothetical protein
MSINDSPVSHTDPRQVIQHDLRHALFTLRTGIALLEQVREDPEKFAEIHQLLQQELTTTSRLIDEVLSADVNAASAQPFS